MGNENTSKVRFSVEGSDKLESAMVRQRERLSELEKQYRLTAEALAAYQKLTQTAGASANGDDRIKVMQADVDRLAKLIDAARQKLDLFMAVATSRPQRTSFDIGRDLINGRLPGSEPVDVNALSGAVSDSELEARRARRAAKNAEDAARSKQLISDILAHYKSVGAELKGQPLVQVSSLGLSGLLQVHQALGLIEGSANRAKSALYGIGSINLRGGGSRPRIGGQAPLGGAFNVQRRSGMGPDDFSDRVGRVGTGGSAQSRNVADARAGALSSEAARTQNTLMANYSLLGRFNRAAVETEQGYYKIGKASEAAAKAGATFSGVTYVGTAILRTMGIEGSRAIETVARQFLDLGLGWEDLWKSKLFRYTTVAAVALGFAELSKEINEAQQASLKLAQTQAGYGLSGDIRKRTDDIDKLKQAVQELDERRLSGAVNEPKFFDKFFGIQDLTTTQNVLNTLIRGAGSFVTLGHDFGDVFTKPELLIKNEEQLIQQIITAQRVRRDLEEKIGVPIEQRTVVQNSEQVHLEMMLKYQDQALDKARKRRELDQRTDEELTDRDLRTAREIEERIKREDRLRASAAKTLDNLRSQGADNPIAQLFLKARSEMDGFEEQFREIPGRLASIKEQIAQNLQLPTFKLVFGLDEQNSSLASDLYRLQSGLGGEGLAKQAADKEATRLKLEEDIYQARRSGDSFRVRQLQNQLSTGGFESTKDRVEREIRGRELASLQQALALAPKAGQAFVLDQILKATQNTSELTREQLDVRTKALQQRLAIGEADRSRVDIFIRNGVEGVTTSIEQDLGPNTGAASSFLPVAGGSTSPYSGDFDPLGGGY